MNNIKEGDLYKILKIENYEFEIRYGYYEEKDKYSKYNEPIPIYPNFIEEPVYITDGYPLVTRMQINCKYIKSKYKDDSCNTCSYFKDCDDLIGICTCIHNKKNV